MANGRGTYSVFFIALSIYFAFQWNSKRTEKLIKAQTKDTVYVIKKDTLKVVKPHGVSFYVNTPVENKSKAACVKKWYKNEVGVREVGGNNKGKRIGYYLKTTANLPEGYAWCAAFVYTGCYECGVKAPKSAMAAVISTGNIIYKQNTKRSFPSIVGKDSVYVFGIYNKSLKRIGHTGFIDKIQSSAVVTYEGNTNGSGSRDGDGVEILIRPKGVIYCISAYN